jgi:outer membrane protein TolC
VSARLAVAAALLVLCGCAGLTPAERAPRTDPVARLQPAGPSPWTEDLGNPTLRELLAQADAGALEVKTALARLERAQGELDAAQAMGRLRVSVGAAAAIGGRNLSQSRSAATPTFEGAYDLDLWHRYARGRQAAAEDRKAADWDVAAARLLVGAETVRAYAALQAARDAETGASRRREDAQAALALTRLRVSQGALTPSGVAPRTRAVASADADIEQAKAEVSVQAARLADLTGQRELVPPPGGLVVIAPLSASADSAKVDARPDVQAAYARLAAADQRRAAAVLATRPQFQVAAALGAPDAAIATLLDVRALAWAVAGTVAHEVLDGGVRRAQVRIASAEADLADLAYRQAVLAGWSEIRASLAAEANAARQVSLAQADVTAARAALAVGERRHAAGAIDGMAMSALVEEAETANDGLRQASLQATEARIRRVLATGGR